MAIPLPNASGFGDFSQGMDVGSGLFQRMMQPVMQQRGMNQAQNQFLQNMALKQKQQAMAEQLLPFQIQQAQASMGLTNEQAEKLRFERDPEKQVAMIRQMIEGVKGMGGDFADPMKMNPLVKAVVEKTLGRPLGYQPTPQMKNANFVYNEDNDPQARQFVADSSRQLVNVPGAQPGQEIIQQDIARQFPASNPEELGGIISQLNSSSSMNYLYPGERGAKQKEMAEELKDIQTAKVTKSLIGQAKEIMRENPDLYRKAVGIIVNPEQDPKKIDSALRAVIPKSQLEPFLQLNKLYSDILVKQASKNNMTRSVYGMKLQQQAKPQAKNPNEVNELIFKNILHEIEPQIGREKALLYAMKNNLYLPRSYDYAPAEGASGAPVSSAQLANVSTPTPIGMMKGIYKGQEVDVHPDNEQAFIAKGGKLR